MEGEKKTKIRFGFKKLVRAISPLVRGTSSKPPQTNDDETQNQPDPYQFSWDLSNVDLKTALKNFYRKYNPEKSFAVGEIIQKYQGDETILLQQLCERYNLSEHDMQEFLDQAPSKQQVFEEKIRENTTRRPSFSLFTKSSDKDSSSERSRSASRNRPSVTKDPKSPSMGQRQQMVEKDRDNESVQSSVTKESEARPRRASFGSLSTAQTELQESEDRQKSQRKYESFYWDLTDIDLSKALKLLYKELNPSKTPNLSVLDHKTPKEILHLLRQLCKRHDLTEAEMGAYLRQAKRRETSEKEEEDESLAALDWIPPPPEKPKEVSRSENMMTARHIVEVPSSRPAASRRYSVEYLKPVLPNGKKLSLGPVVRELQGIPEEGAATATATATNINEEEEEDRPRSLLPFRPSASAEKKLFSISPSITSAGEVRQLSQPTPTTIRAAPTLTNNTPPLPPPQTALTSAAIAANSEVIIPSSSSNSGMSGNNNNNNTIGYATSNSYTAATNTPSDSYTTAATTTTTTAAITRTPFPPPPPTTITNNNTITTTTNNNSAGNRQTDTNHDVSNATNTNSTTIARPASSPGPDLALTRPWDQSPFSYSYKVAGNNGRDKAVQAEDFSLKTDLSKAKLRLSSLQDQLQSLLREKLALDEEREEAVEEKRRLSRQLQESLQDKRDLLQLLDILASAPVPAKTVLESYLSKLSQSSPSSSDKSLSLGDRINALLKWKRDRDRGQESPSQNNNNNNNKEEERGEEQQRTAVVDEDGAGERELAAEEEKKEEEEEQEVEQERGQQSEKDKDSAAVRVTAEERRLYQRLNVNGLNPPEPRVSKNGSGSSRHSTPSHGHDNNSHNSHSSSHSPRPTASSTTTSEEKEEHELLKEQYDLAKKFYHHQQSQAKVSQQLQQSNLAYQELVARRGVSPQRLSSSPSHNHSNSNSNNTSRNKLGEEEVAEGQWIECFDPKSQRKYFYNTRLKKSTWKTPSSLASSRPTNPDDNNNTSNSNTSSRPLLPQQTEKRLLFDRQGYPVNSGTSRSSSPSSRSSSSSPFLQNYLQSTQSLSNNSSSNSASSQKKKEVWVTAVDPKTQRRYWYNRETKTSTWRKPIDL